MDWRAMSRSRSRLSMDWRPASRSRSRPPPQTTFDQHGMTAPSFDGRFAFPTLGQGRASNDDTKPEKGISSSIPIPGSSLLSTSRRSPPYLPHPSRSDLSSVYEDQADVNGPTAFENSADSRYMSSLNFNHSLSSYSSPAFAPSSLPSSGLHGLTRIPSSNGPSPEHRSFPRHVRKTSFDHTVSKDGIFSGLSGRHQVNGKPLSPDSLIGTKRRADEAPHAESMLRADPSNVDGHHNLLQEHQQDSQQFEAGSPFPSSSFDFSFPPYDGLFSLSGPHDYSSGLHSSDNHTSEGIYSDSGRSSINGSSYAAHIGSPTSGSEGLSAAAAAASAAMAEGYAQLSAVNLAGIDDPSLDYQHLMGMVYSGLDTNRNIGSPYTHVDPTQILSSVDGGDNSYQSFHASPSSDGWGNGVNSSSNASPEPYNTSSASTPPSAEGVPNGSGGHGQNGGRNAAGRKHPSLKQETQRKKTMSTSSTNKKSSLGELRSSASTPDLTEAGQQNKGDSDDGEQTPTLCTNCQTTNTPLWRRDPDGHPLCMSVLLCPFSVQSLTTLSAGNACGLFYVSSCFPIS